MTDEIAEAILYGNVIYTIGSILVAAATTVRSYKFMIFGRVILALGDIATKIAQYKIFSSWFPPSHGFAATLGLELGIGKACPTFITQVTKLTSIDRRLRRKINSKHYLRKDRRLLLGLLDSCVHEFLHERHDSPLLLLHSLLQGKVSGHS